jgi:membrane protease YdiL (CAAX protease family)
MSTTSLAARLRALGAAPWDDRRVALKEAFGFVAVVAALSTLGALAGLFVAGPLVMLLSIGYVIWRTRSSGAGVAAVGLARPESIPRTLLTGLGGWFVVALFVGSANLGLRALGAAPDLEAMRFVEGNLSAYLLMLGMAWTSAAFGEEIAFRGYLFHRLETGFGGGRRATAIALLLQALIFSLGHIYQGWAGMLVTGLVGLCLGGLLLRVKRNLWVPIVTHGVIDTLGLTAIYLGILSRADLAAW